MQSIIKGVRLGGLSAAVPERQVSLKEQCANGELGNIDEAVIQKFTKRTGVAGRYLAHERQTSSDLCCAAAKQLLDEKKIDKEQIGVLVYVTQTADYRSPATAAVMQYRLGIGKECIAFDVNLGCSGFTCGLNIAGSLLEKSDTKYALLLCGETPARERNRKEPTFASNADKMLFGDAGTALLLEKDENAPDLRILSKTDGSGYQAIIIPYQWYRNPVKGQGAMNIMDEIEVFNFSTSKAPALILELMKIAGKTVKDYDCLVLHQANLFIMNRIAKLTGFEKEKMLTSIEAFANTSCASIPVTLVHNYGAGGVKTEECAMCWHAAMV